MRLNWRGIDDWRADVDERLTSGRLAIGVNKNVHIRRPRPIDSRHRTRLADFIATIDG
jgi:hypothetical protein